MEPLHAPWRIEYIQAADAQNYHPRYGFSSDTNPAATAVILGPEAFVDSAGAGYQPPQDVGQH